MWSRQKPSPTVKSRQTAFDGFWRLCDGFWRLLTAFDGSTSGGGPNRWAVYRKNAKIPKIKNPWGIWSFLDIWVHDMVFLASYRLNKYPNLYPCVHQKVQLSGPIHRYPCRGGSEIWKYSHGYEYKLGCQFNLLEAQKTMFWAHMSKNDHMPLGVLIGGILAFCAIFEPYVKIHHSELLYKNHEKC